MNDICEKMLRLLESEGIEYELHSHEPVHMSKDREPMGLTYGGAVCKNLFLTTRAKSHYLLVMLLEHHHADLRALARWYKSSRLTFASDEDVFHILGLHPGYIGVSGFVMPSASKVGLIVDRELESYARVCVHPGDITKTLVMSYEGFLTYLRACGHEPLFYDFSDGGNNV